MIIREWRGRAALSNPEAYPSHFHSNVLPELLGVPGFIGAQLGKRQLSDAIEYLVLTRWQSHDSIRNFAGSDIGKAIVEPAAIAALIDYDDRVHHYDVVDGAERTLA